MDCQDSPRWKSELHPFHRNQKVCLVRIPNACPQFPFLCNRIEYIHTGARLLVTNVLAVCEPGGGSARVQAFLPAMASILVGVAWPRTTPCRQDGDVSLTSPFVFITSTVSKVLCHNSYMDYRDLGHLRGCLATSFLVLVQLVIVMTHTT